MNAHSANWKLRFLGTAPKDSNFPDSNEDKLRICEQRRLFALSDGASESFDSALWADILVEAAIERFSTKCYCIWLKRAISDYEDRSRRSSMSWSQEAAFARGSFASLLVVQLQDEAMYVTAIGDTVALLIEDNEIRCSFPYTHSAEFGNRPTLLCTLLDRHKTSTFRTGLRSLVSRHPSKHEKLPFRERWTYPSSNNSSLLCVTDAVGEWLLRNDSNARIRLERLLAVESQEDFASLIDDARASDGMRRDDSTIIMLGHVHATTDT